MGLNQIIMYIFKEKKFINDFQSIKKDIRDFVLKMDLSQYSFRINGQKLEGFYIEFKERNDISYIEIYSYLPNSWWERDKFAKDLEDLFFDIYKSFFLSEVAYLYSDGELQSGLNDLIFAGGKKVQLFGNDLSYYIREILTNYGKGVK